MKIIFPILSAIIAAGLVFLLMQHRVASIARQQHSTVLQDAVLSVQKELGDLGEQINARLAAFTEGIAANRDFSIKLLVENDRSAPVIAESALRYQGAMGFTLLELTDSAGTILSSGHFPASAGNSASKKLALLSNKPVLIEDNVMGTQVLSFQSKKTFKIADITFYAMGGVTVDEEFLARLSPHEGIRVLVRRGNDITGMPNVKSLSKVKDDKIIINDKEFSAREIALPYNGDGEAPVLIVIVQ